MITGGGLGLSQRFYQERVAPLLAQHFPTLRYAAARLGRGSEVLGYDTPMSADHDYGPTVQLFLTPEAFPSTALAIMSVLDAYLPATFEGFATHYCDVARAPGPEQQRTGMVGSAHGVELYTVTDWCQRFLQHPCSSALTPEEWLSFPEQFFLMVTAGGVFRDDDGDLTALRARLAWFPRDVWLCKLAAQWTRICVERAYVGRAGSVGDELGSQVIATRMVGNIMRLALLIEKKYAPYPKWLGSAFARLKCAPELTPLLEKVTRAEHWQARESALKDACEFVAWLQKRENVPGAIAPKADSLHGRPYQFVNSLEISNAVLDEIADEQIKGMGGYGAIDQSVDNGVILAVPETSRAVMRALLAGG
nr:DUF4037 domain-containing protein [uncultured Enterobacter sp.]